MEAQDIKGEVFKLADLIDYHDGSVVSREIVKGETGNVTVFAFDEGEGLSEHIAPFDALVQVMDGAVEIVISGNPLMLQAGESVIMPANQPHSLKGLGRFKMLLTMIKS